MPLTEFSARCFRATRVALTASAMALRTGADSTKARAASRGAAPIISYHYRNGVMVDDEGC